MLTPMKLAALLLCAWVLTGCGPRMQTYMVKPGATDAEWRRDDYECSRDASMTVRDVYGSWSYSRLAVDGPMWTKCMEARGWHRESRPR